MLRFIRTAGERHTLVATTVFAGAAVSFVAVGLGQEAIVVQPFKVEMRAPGSKQAAFETLPRRASDASENAIAPNGYEHLGEDILRCNECRRRLGLPPLALPDNQSKQEVVPSTNHKLTEPSAGIHHGSSVSGSSTPSRVTAKVQLAPQAFTPPPVGLSGLPIEARQQLLQGLSLPEGATILSAKFIDPPAKPVEGNDKKPESQTTPPVINAANSEEPATSVPQVPKIAVPSPAPLNKQTIPEPVVTEAKADPSKRTEPARTDNNSQAEDKSLDLPNQMKSAVGPLKSTIKIIGDSEDAKPEEKKSNQPVPDQPNLDQPKPDQSDLDAKSQSEKSKAPNTVIASPRESKSPSDAIVTTNDSNESIASPPMLENPTPENPKLESQVDSGMLSSDAKTTTASTPAEAVATPIPMAEPTTLSSPEVGAERINSITTSTPESRVDSNPLKSATTLAPDAKALVVDGVLRSPALQQIQIDFLKKQLAERDELIRQLNSMPPIFQQQIDELARVNDQLRKREQERIQEAQQIRIEAQQASQKHEVKMVELKADLLATQQQLQKQELLFQERMSDAETAHFTELVKLRKELTEIQNDKASTIARLRQELDALVDSKSKQATRQIAEQQTIIEAHLKSIEKLERQLESALAIQQADINRLESTRQTELFERSTKMNPIESVSELSGKDLTDENSGVASEVKERASKPFELPVPKTKSSKPKVPRIETPKGANESTRSF
jgi:hypothetical protein